MSALNMNAWRAVIRFALVALAGFPLGAAEAQEVYRWVDENGVVNFSDRAPSAAPETGVSTLKLEDNRSAAYDPEQDLFNIQSTQERTQALREELQEQREARHERSASQPVVVQQPEQRNYGYPWDYPYGYPSLRPGGKPPIRPPYKPRPPPEPPADDTSTWRPPGQLPRSD
ncbi:MAG: DUF4124 domain-containing protein [Lysobacterales bacterium]